MHFCFITRKLTFRGHLPRKPPDHLVLCLRSPQELQWEWNPGLSVIERIVQRLCMFEQRFWYNLQVIACQISSFLLFSFISLIPLMRFIIEEKQLFKYDWHHSYPAVRSWLSEDRGRLLCWPLWPLLRLAALWPCTHVDLFGMNSDVKNFAGANYLTIAMPGPAQMQLVKQLQGREKLWTELNCVQSISQFQLTFSRGRIPISLSIASSSRSR